MKTKLIVTIFTLITLLTVARQVPPFQGWAQLGERSPYIIIAHCGKPVPPSGPVMNGPNSDYAIEVVSVLKGTNNISSARLWTDREVQQGENYLIFGYFENGIYQAFEEYRVIPLGGGFSINSIVSKSLDEQLQILFKARIDILNREIQADKMEIQRLEEGIKQK